MPYDITLLLDGIILVFLCVTIFYAARLSLFMKSFRQGKSEIQRLIRDLNATVDRAESAILSMKDNASGVESEIREVINKAQFLSDELKFMNETGDGLADRLEKLADRNRELVDLMENPGSGAGGAGVKTYDLDHSTDDVLEKAFNIQDFDLDSVELDEDDEFDFLALGDGAYREEEAWDAEAESEMEYSALAPAVDTDARSKVRSFAIFDREYADDFDDEYEELESASNQDFHSRAEQELFEALQRKKQAYDDQHGATDDGAPKKTKVSKLS